MLISSNTVIILCIIAIAVAIFLSIKCDVHMGLAAMSLAFIIGVVLCGYKVKDVYSYWPDNIVFFLLSSALFYGFATENGTILAFGNKLLYIFRHNTLLLGWIVFFVTAIMTLLGAGAAAIFFMTPIAFSMALTVGINPLLMSAAINLGYVAGGYNPWTGTGVMLKGIMEQDIAAEVASPIYMRVYGMFLFKNILYMALFFIFFMFILPKISKKTKAAARSIEMEKPAPFTPIQRKQFTLIIVSFCLILIPNMIDNFISIDNVLWANFVNLCDPYSVMVIFAAISAFLKLADTGKVFKRLPMNSILLIVGVCFIMEIGKANGLLEIISSFFSEDMPTWMMSPALILTAGVLSIFSSATSVVCPLLYPLVPTISHATGMNPVNLYTSITVGAGATALSPFSTAGAQQVALAPDEIKDSMIPGLLGIAIANLCIGVVLGALGFYGILSYPAL